MTLLLAEGDSALPLFAYSAVKKCVGRLTQEPGKMLLKYKSRASFPEVAHRTWHQKEVQTENKVQAFK